MDRRDNDTEILPAIQDLSTPKRYGIFMNANVQAHVKADKPDNTYAIYIQGPTPDKPLLAFRMDGQLELNDGWEKHWFAKMFVESLRQHQARFA